MHSPNTESEKAAAETPLHRIAEAVDYDFFKNKCVLYLEKAEYDKASLNFFILYCSTEEKD